MASSEQRSTFRLLSYWNRIREDQKFPMISQVSIGEMADLWDVCFVLDMSNRVEPEFQHFGSQLVEIFKQDHNGMKLREVDHPVLSDIPKFLDEVWLMESPVSHCGEVSHEDEKLRYRSLLAPVSEAEKEEEIIYLIGTTNYRAY